MHPYEKPLEHNRRTTHMENSLLPPPPPFHVFVFYSATLLVVKFKMTDSSEEVFGLLFLTGYVFTAVL